MPQQIPQSLFNQWLPHVVTWVQQQEDHILGNCDALVLTPEQQHIARRAGVRQPESVRLLALPEIPFPDQAGLRQAAAAAGLSGSGTLGLTAGYGIFVRQDCRHDEHLIAHELQHVAQYERLGGISAFLRQYLTELNEHGYHAAPMEQEAVAFAAGVYPKVVFLQPKSKSR